MSSVLWTGYIRVTAMPEVQDVFRQYGEEYLENYNVPYHLFKTMKAIEHCRTAELGAHVDYCEDCGNVLHVSYNSCRNRHCPKC